MPMIETKNTCVQPWRHILRDQIGNVWVRLGQDTHDDDVDDDGVDDDIVGLRSVSTQTLDLILGRHTCMVQKYVLRTPRNQCRRTDKSIKNAPHPHHPNEMLTQNGVANSNLTR